MPTVKSKTKEHSSRALADASPPDLAGEMYLTARHLPVKTACKKLFSFKCSVFLQFAASPEHRGRARRKEQQRVRHVVWAPLTVSSAAPTLPAITICSREADTVADSKGITSLTSDHMLAGHARISAHDDHRQSCR